MIADMIKPYYQSDGITVYCADCREIIPELGQFDLLLTDPAYGLGEDGGKFRGRKGGGHRVLPKMGWDKERTSPDLIKASCNCATEWVIWGGNYFSDLLPASRGWLYWDKRMGGDFSDGELAYSTRDAVLRSFSYCAKRHGKVHPTQKPLPLIQWSLAFFPDAKTVLDPFGGSLTTAVACKLVGVSCTIIEQSEAYCEAGVRRLRQGVLSFVE